MYFEITDMDVQQAGNDRLVLVSTRLVQRNSAIATPPEIGVLIPQGTTTNNAKKLIEDTVTAQLQLWYDAWQTNETSKRELKDKEKLEKHINQTINF